MSCQKWEVLFTDKNEPKILINFNTMQMKMIQDFDDSNKKRKRDIEDNLVQKDIKKNNRLKPEKKDAQPEENNGEDNHGDDNNSEDNHDDDNNSEDNHDEDLYEDDKTEDDQHTDDRGEDDQTEDDDEEGDQGEDYKSNDSQNDDKIDEYIEDGDSVSSSTSERPEQKSKHYIKNHILDSHKKDIITAARDYMHIKKTKKIRGAIPKWVKKALY